MKIPDRASTTRSSSSSSSTSTQSSKPAEKKSAAAPKSAPAVRADRDTFESAPTRSGRSSGSTATATASARATGAATGAAAGATAAGSTGAAAATGAQAGKTGATTGTTATPPAGAPTLDNVVGALKEGKTDDATRQMIGEYFAPLGMEESNAAMNRIRDEGLLDAFIDATARDRDGNQVTPEVKEGLKLVMGSGKLDVYAETLATVPITVGDFGAGTLQFNPNEPKGVELDRATLAGYDSQGVANILAHEVFHAFSNAHGGPGYAALDEGFGIAAREYAFTDGNYNLAEMVYGTKNFYRDIRGEPNYQFGDLSNVDPKLRELMTAFASRDSSQLAWDKPDQLQAEYDKFFAPISRNQDWNTWLDAVNTATADMLAAREAAPAADPAVPAGGAGGGASPAPTNPLQQFWDWLTGLLG